MKLVTLDPLNAEAPLESLGEDITPTSQFFARNHFRAPKFAARKHRLRIGGSVERPLELSVDDLRALRQRSVTMTLECAGNGRSRFVPLPAGEPWDDGAVSTARWTGVPLRTVLGRARIRPAVIEILAVGADRGRVPGVSQAISFARSLPLEKADDVDTLIALEMNERPIPREHGGPMRLIVPGWYGMASVKWLAGIEALTEAFRGYYQTTRYVYDFTDARPGVPVTTVRVRSLITSPVQGETVRRGRVVIAGKAWSGEGALERVEVSVSGGGAWREAKLRPGASRFAWRTWGFVWNPDEPGRHVLRSRAADAWGVQPELARWNRHGYGNNSIHAISVTVR